MLRPTAHSREIESQFRRDPSHAKLRLWATAKQRVYSFLAVQCPESCTEIILSERRIGHLLIAIQIYVVPDNGPTDALPAPRRITALRLPALAFDLFYCCSAKANHSSISLERATVSQRFRRENL